MWFPLQSLLDSKSLKFIVGLTLQDRTTKSLMHLHKKKKPPSISAQFQVQYLTPVPQRTCTLNTPVPQHTCTPTHLYPNTPVPLTHLYP